MTTVTVIQSPPTTVNVNSDPTEELIIEVPGQQGPSGGGSGTFDGDLDDVPDSATRLAMVPAERTKLSGVATGATANSSDAVLLSRANHTGTQSAGTITGLATVATSGDYADLSNLPAIPSDLDDITDSATRLAFLPAERTKLTGIATGATANSSDATLLARVNHTGTQDVSTITGLATVATSGDYGDLTGAPTLATVATSGDYNDLINIPDLSGVVTTDLSGTSGAVALYSDNPDEITSNSLVTVDDNGFLSAIRFDATRADATSMSFIAKVSGDAVSRWRVDADGKTSWGDGTTLDTTLYRNSAGVLKTDGNLIIGTVGTAAGSVVTVNGTQTLTNKTIAVGQITGLAAVATSGSYSDLSGTSSLVTLTGSQTVTNKTLSFKDDVNTVGTSGTTQTIPDPLTAQAVSRITLTANCTFTFPTAAAGKSFTLILVQDGTGSRTVTWPGTVIWPSGTPPTLTVAINKHDIFTFLCSDGTNWDGFYAGANYA